MPNGRIDTTTRGGGTTALTGGAAGLPGTAPQSGTGLGLVPTVPSPIGTQGEAISGNMGNLASLYGLTGSLNTNIAQQAALPFQLNLPNYGAMTGESSNNILSQLKGQVPSDVVNQLAQLSAERGVANGISGSPDANTALLAALGKTSMGLQQQGEQNLTAAMQRTPTGQQFNPASFLVNPAQMQDAQYMASLYAAAPNPNDVASAGISAAKSGLGAGMSYGGGFNRGTPGVGTDALGFPSVNMNGGLPADIAYGPTGTPMPNSENGAAWNSWNQGQAWNTNAQANDNYTADFEDQFWGNGSQNVPDFQTGMAPTADSGSGDFFSGGDMFSDY